MNTTGELNRSLKGPICDLFVDRDCELYLSDVYMAISTRSNVVTNASKMTDSLWNEVFSVSAFIPDFTNPDSGFNLVCSAVKFKKSLDFDQTSTSSVVVGSTYDFRPRSARSQDTEIFSLKWTDTLTKTEILFEPFTDVKVGHSIAFHSEMWKPEFNSVEFVRIPKLETPWPCVQYKRDAVEWLQHHHSNSSITPVMSSSYRKNWKRQKLMQAKEEKKQPCDTVKSETHTTTYCAYEKIPWPTQEDLERIDDMQMHELHHLQSVWNPEAVRIRYAHLSAIKLRHVVDYSTILHSELLKL